MITDVNRKEIISELEGLVKFITCPEYVQKAFALIIELTEENERLRGFNQAKCEDCAGCTQWNCDCANIEADTVRKMQDRLAQCIGTYTDKSFVYVNAMFKLIDQIAKEMLEGNNESQS